MCRTIVLLALVTAALSACAGPEPVSLSPQPTPRGYGVIEGCVRLAPDDRPIKADLDVHDAQGNTMPRLQDKPTNRRGCFTIKGLQAGVYTISARARIDGGIATGEAVVEVRHAATTVADIVVTPSTAAP